MDLSDKGAGAGTYAATNPQHPPLCNTNMEESGSAVIDHKYPPPPLIEYSANHEKGLPLLSYHGGTPSTRDYSGIGNVTAFQPFRPSSLPASAEMVPRSSSVLEPYNSSSHRLPSQELLPYPAPPSVTASIGGVTSAVSRLPDPYASSAARFSESYPPPPAGPPEEYWNRYMGRHNYHIPYYTDKSIKSGFPTKYEPGATQEVDHSKSTKSSEVYGKELRSQPDYSSSSGVNEGSAAQHPTQQQPPPIAEVKVEAEVGQQQQYQPVNYKVESERGHDYQKLGIERDGSYTNTKDYQAQAANYSYHQHHSQHSSFYSAAYPPGPGGHHQYPNSFYPSQVGT